MGKKFEEVVKGATEGIASQMAFYESRPKPDLSTKSITIGKRVKGGEKESVIQSAILDFLRCKNIYAWRNNNQGRIIQTKVGAIMGQSFAAGTSDILGCLPNGKFLAIEVKRPGGKVTAGQANFIDRIRSCGGVAIIATSVDEVRAALEGVL